MHYDRMSDLIMQKGVDDVLFFSYIRPSHTLPTHILQHQKRLQCKFTHLNVDLNTSHFGDDVFAMHILTISMQKVIGCGFQFKFCALYEGIDNINWKMTKLKKK